MYACHTWRTVRWWRSHTFAHVISKKFTSRFRAAPCNTVISYRSVDFTLAIIFIADILSIQQYALFSQAAWWCRYDKCESDGDISQDVYLRNLNGNNNLSFWKRPCSITNCHGRFKASVFWRTDVSAQRDELFHKKIMKRIKETKN